MELLNELRHANGVTKDIATDEAYLKHAEERSNEMATTGVLSMIPIYHIQKVKMFV